MDNHKIVQVIQSDTTTYGLQDLDEVDITKKCEIETYEEDQRKSGVVG